MADDQTIGLIGLIITTTIAHKAPAQDRQTLASLFSIDIRSLAAVRIGISLLLIADSVATLTSSAKHSLVSVLASLLLLPIASGLLVGYKTRLLTALGWVVYGVPLRQSLLEPGMWTSLGRYILCLYLFWSIFLPVDRYFSIGSRSSRTHPHSVLSVASAGALIQLFLIYFFAGVNKDFTEWVTAATAMHDILTSSGYATEVGSWVANAGGLMSIVSVATILLEIVGSILLFVPRKGLEMRRELLVGAFVLFHAGMALFMNLGIFPYVMMTIWLLFLPGRTWDRLVGRPAEQVPVQTDQHLARNLTASAALAYILVSNYITWALYPAQSGWPKAWQDFGIALLLYQQWAMFSIPSTLA
jgi:hypothetical protein